MNIQLLLDCGWRERGYKGPQYPAKVCSCDKLEPMNRLEPVSRTNNKPYHTEAEALEMESMPELIVFARELLSQRPRRGLLKVYLAGSVLALLGTVVGLVETVCHPFSCGEHVDPEVLLMLARGQSTPEAEPQCTVGDREEEEEEEEEEKLMASDKDAVSRSTALLKTHGPQGQRSTANRLHAS